MNSSLENTPIPSFKADCALPLAHGISLIAVNAMICAFGTLGNVMVCLAVFINPRLRRSSNYLLFSLAIADLIVTLVCEPLLLKIFSMRTFFEDCSTAHLNFPYMILSSISCSASVAHLAAISVDRLIAVCFPLRHKTRMNKCGLTTMLVISWVYSISVTVLTFVLPKSIPRGLLVGILYGLCVLIIVLSYLIILAFVFYQKRKRNKLKGRPSSSEMSSRMEVRITCTLAIVIGVFTVCWVPVIAALFAAVIKFDGPTFMWLRTLALSNSAMNFWIYTARIPDFRDVYAKIRRKVFW
ncbi:adenosine receptor A2a-like [Montipora foliosa]|uniref:adenosine receptor A2a-like n=1 Tax=Montipora foliosa TaxID=591990 RepID=UPI0035F1D51B